MKSFTQRTNRPLPLKKEKKKTRFTRCFLLPCVVVDLRSDVGASGRTSGCRRTRRGGRRSHRATFTRCPEKGVREAPRKRALAGRGQPQRWKHGGAACPRNGGKSTTGFQEGPSSWRAAAISGDPISPVRRRLARGALPVAGAVAAGRAPASRRDSCRRRTWVGPVDAPFLYNERAPGPGT